MSPNPVGERLRTRSPTAVRHSADPGGTSAPFMDQRVAVTGTPATETVSSVPRVLTTIWGCEPCVGSNTSCLITASPRLR